MSAVSQGSSRAEGMSSEDMRVMTRQVDHGQVRKLVEDHFADLWRFLRHLGVPEHWVDDATQEVFIVAARRFDEILPGRERSFLFGTAFKIAQSTRRKLGRAAPPDDDSVMEAKVDTAPNPEEELDDKQARELALRLIDELDEGQRQVFVMFEIEGMTLQHIAELTELPMNTVASRLRSAREVFQTRFARHRNIRRAGR